MEEMGIFINDEYDMKLPRMVKVRQHLAKEKIADIGGCLQNQLAKPEIKQTIKPGMKIAVGVGSRGIAGLTTIVKTLVDVLKAKGAEPFIVPAMGSHGGATSEGQLQVLAGYGITTESMGVPIISSMDVKPIGKLLDGPELFFDQVSLSADGIIPVNRVKPHTAFQGEIQSGLLKMLVIGFGNHKGAASVHRYGADRFHRVIPEAGKFLLQNTPVLFGIAIVENAAEEPAIIEAVRACDIYEREKELLKEAKRLMARIPIDHMDVLVISEIGKNISGPGMDPNVTGRFAPRYLSYERRKPEFQRMVLLDLTEKSYGNAGAVGLADVVTRRLVDKINFQHTYINNITSAVPEAARIPLIADTDHQALVIALKTCYRVEPPKARVVWIKNTLDLERLWVSEALLAEVRNNPQLEVSGELIDMPFNEDGELQLQYL